jgi:3-hydroxybutyryl-CoA dehydratase
MPQLSNFTYEDITIGQTARYSKRVTERDIQLFAAVSGDRNPVHLDPEFAARSRFGERIAHGMLTGAFISAALAMHLPGPGTIFVSQSLRFRQPVMIGDEVTVELEVTGKQDRRGLVTIDCRVQNQRGKLVASGVSEVMPSREKMRVDLPELPPIQIG